MNTIRCLYKFRSSNGLMSRSNSAPTCKPKLKSRQRVLNGLASLSALISDLKTCFIARKVT